MRPGLPHPIADRAERRHTRRHRVKRGASPLVQPEPLATPDLALAKPDLAVQRVRAAGGPLDQACYTCECGYVFAASVSTTVACPHCGAGQAW
jgi:hypothetical protein